MITSHANSTWLPTDETSLVWWLDASDLTSIDKNATTNAVAIWYNKKISGGLGDQSNPISTTLFPIWRNNVINDRPAVEFYGGDCTIGPMSFTGPDSMLIAIGSLNGGSSGGALAAFAATGFASNQAGGGIWWKRDAATEAINSNFTGNTFGSLPITYDVPHMFTGTRTPTRSDNYLNGGTTPNGTNQVLTTDFDLCSLGTNITSAGALGGGTAACRISELLLFGSVDLTLRQYAEGYIAHRWGVLLDPAHPWQQRAP